MTKPWDETWRWTDTWRPRPEDPEVRHSFHKLVDDRGAQVISDGSAYGEYGADIDVDGPYGTLIAAAPDLYRALAALDHHFGAGHPRDDGVDFYPKALSDQVMAALRKARGGP